MSLQTPLENAPEALESRPSAASPSLRSATVWTIGLFIVFWCVFYLLRVGLPYLTNGSDIIFRSKVDMEEHDRIFPADPSVTKVMIFGDSKVLAGFLPAEFDRMAAEQHLKVSSFNSGFPGTDVFLPELRAIARNGQAPDVLLLTLPWKKEAALSPFHLVRDDDSLILRLFPFRFWLRDTTSFMMNSRRYGGVRAGYQAARKNQEMVRADRGYYLILEQSHFPGGRLPAGFHLASDTPHRVEPRLALPVNSQTKELNRLVARYHMRCYYLPQYYRIGEFAPAPAINTQFATAIARDTPCRVLGPDYFLYPPQHFSDQTHVNRDGAHSYTADIFRLIKNELGRVRTDISG